MGTGPIISTIKKIKEIKTKKPTLSIYSPVEKVIEYFNLLPKERREFIVDQIKEDKFQSVVLEDKRVIPDWVTHPLCNKIFNAHDCQKHYNIGLVLNAILTEEEVLLLNKHANEIYLEKREKERFEKADKVLEKDWNGPVFTEATGWNDGYFQNIEEFRDYCEDDEFEMPSYVWACKELPILSGCAGGLIEKLTQFEGEYDYGGEFEGEKEFEEAVNKFLEKNKEKVYYEIDHSTVIILKK